MKPASKSLSIFTALFFLAAGGSFASTNADLFKAVPAGDPTYNRLSTLETAGLIPEGSSSKTLTRYEVADLILEAKKNYKAIVVADAVLPSSSTVPPLPGLPDAVALPAATTSSSALTAPASTPATTSASMASAMPPASTDDSDNYAAPPPPSESVMNSDSSAAVATPPPAAPTPKPIPNYAQHPELLQSAEAALTSLDEAYEVELQAVMQSKGILLDDLNKAESDQYQLWRDVKSVTESPSLSIHGIGRMFAVSQNIYGSFSLVGQSKATTHIGPSLVTYYVPVTLTNPETQYMNGYLDLDSAGTITKQLQWDAIVRLGTSALPLTGDFQYNNAFGTANNVNYDTLNFRWIALHLSPDFMSMDLGDFYESYTPLTMWNRNNLDLFYKPEPIARADDEYKYESFFNHQPDWPFRGVRLGTALGWPDSNVLDKFKLSAFVHMISNGFNDWPNNGWMFSPNTLPASSGNPGGQTNFFPDFIYAAQADLELKKWFMGDLSIQFAGKAYVVIMDQLDNPYNQLNYLNYAGGGIAATPVTEFIYNPNNPNTWAHQYRISSFKPQMRIGLGGDVYLGAQYEGSFAEYQDDKNNKSRTISDFAVFADPYLQFDSAKLTFDVLNVGPNYYSPLAQSREDFITPLSGTSTTALPGAGIFTAPLRGQYFLIDQRSFTTNAGISSIQYIDVPRANAIFGYYDRTQDNVFPYGLATPNRQGVGFNVDLKSLPDKAFQMAGAVYFLSEISDNLVVNSGGSAYTAVDSLPNGTAPTRNFTYVNLGPSLDLGPALQLKTPLEVGTNIRYESTTSQVGTLTDLWWLSGVRVGLFPWWEVTAAAGIKTANGTDMGMDGTTLARYSYIENNQDLGTYSAFTVDDSEQQLLFSMTFLFDSHSKLHLDYSFETGMNNGSNNSGLASGTNLVAPGTILTAPGNTLSGGSLNATINVQYAEMVYEIEF